MSELSHFATNKRLIDTRLAKDTRSLKTYLAGVSEHNGVYVVALWNEVQNTGNAINSLPGDATVGSARAVRTRVAKGNIPGYPTYFVAIPADELIGTLRVIDNIPGLDAFRSYMGNFLEGSTRAAVVELVGGEVQIAGYRRAKGRQVEPLHPRFSLQVRRNRDQAEMLRTNASRVRKVVRVRELDVVANPSDFTIWQEFMVKLGLPATAATKEEMRIKYEVDINQDEAAVIRLINENENIVVAKENDYGFILQGDAETHWLSNAIAGGKLEIEVNGVNGVFQADVLSSALGRRKSVLRALAKL